MNHQVVTDYTDVNTENSSVCVYVRARPPDPSWTLQDDDASVEDKFQNPLQATLAGLSPKSNSGGQSPAPQATSSAFITNFPDNPKKICIKDPAAQGAVKHHGEIYFSFDRVFWTECSQEEIFQAVAKPQVENLVTGFNGCCFAYGQTGSGKTYSMFGEGAGNSRGMIPRCMEEVFVQLDRKSKDREVAVVVSFLEIYCDRVRDLGEAFLSHGVAHRLRTTSDVHQKLKSSRAESFQPRNKHGSGPNSNHPGAGSNGGVWDSYPSMDLKIHEDVQGNVFVKDLSLIPVTTLEEVLEIISLGLKVRATHETKMNQVSSRSHTVFTVTVVQRDPCTDETMTGILNLVDLAGSERLKKSASEGQRKTEALHINSSLTALGKVVMALDPSSGLTHVPYRDSKLTRLLQNSLGGNSFTVVLATVHPIARFSEECLSTLQFANRCRSVHNNPRVNKLGDGPAGDQRKLKKLQDEIQALRSRLGNGGAGPGGVTEDANARVLAVLAQMGLEGASQLPNGSIRLPDGRIVGNFGLDGGGSGGDASNCSASGGGAAGAGTGAYTSAILRGVPSNVRTMVQGLEGEVRGVKKKLKERKQELLSIQGQLDARRAVFVESETQSKRRETELAGQLAVAQAQLCEVRAATARSKDEQLEAVLAGSQTLLRRQRRMLLKATGHSSTPETDARALDVISRRERKEEEARYAQSLRALVFSKEVETENLRQKYEQLLQAEADGRAVTKAQLERFRAHRDREVRDLSAELLLLHDHASSLGEDIQAAGLTSSPPLEADFGDGGPINANSPANQSLPLAAPLMPHSASLPHLLRLLKARGVAPSRSYQSSNDRHLAHSQSETVLVQGAGNGSRRRRGQTTTAATHVRARPRSAGVARRWPGNTSSRHALGQGSEAGRRGAGPAPATRTKNNAGRDVGLSRGTGRIRPMSAPGRRPEGKKTPGEGPQFFGPVEANARGEGQSHQLGVGHPTRTMLGGWSAQDVLDRNAGELSRGGLLCLVRALRENLCVGDGHNHDGCGGPANHGAPQLGGNHVPEVTEGAEGVRPDAQTLLREQTRRYNDLRVAHASLCRRLEKGQRGVGSRSARIGQAARRDYSTVENWGPRRKDHHASNG